MNYQSIHDSIIDRAKTRVLPKEVYTERHHIIPRCMGGSDDKSNLVDLTAKEHFIVHKLLVEIHPNEFGLVHAYYLFVNGTNKNNHKGNEYYHIGAKEYERVKLLRSKVISEKYIGDGNPMFGRSGKKAPMFGRSGEKHPMFGKNYKKRPEHSIRMSGENNPNFGKNMSGENNPNFGNGKKISGENNPNSKKVICGVTGKIYGCIKDAAESVGRTPTTLRFWFKNPEKNKSSLRYL